MTILEMRVRQHNYVLQIGAMKFGGRSEVKLIVPGQISLKEEYHIVPEKVRYLVKNAKQFAANVEEKCQGQNLGLGELFDAIKSFIKAPEIEIIQL